MASHALLHDIMQRMHDYNCPICDLLRSTTDRRLNQLLYEHVTDPDFVTNFLNGNGFCNHHSDLMLKKGDPLAHAILYSHLLDKQTIHFVPSKLKQKNSKSSKQCYLCSHETKNEVNYITGFIKSYKNDIFKDTYIKQGILCMNHFKMVKDSPIMIKSLDYYRFIKATEEKYTTIYDALSEIKRKSDYRFKDEGWTSFEKVVWKKIVSLSIDQFEYLRKKTP